MSATQLFSIGLLAIALTMLLWHHRSWLAKRDVAEGRERSFLARQYRRRLQVGVMLALVALAIGAGPWLERLREQRPGLYLAYWLLVLVVVLWTLLLALADYVDSRQHFAHEGRQQTAERARLQAELQQLHAERDEEQGGQPPTADDGPSQADR
ncbi:MAG: hypothetical protein DWQ31_15220 [Planctomycetota bacterium]|nr:MAG: hypothetical protein DWQ31_15220 [Planctomycetota bacterium]REJ88311.1 MAG: hypothetical protein DWQ35_20270 [Planctomycetota bacterium]REK22960.1 MAG: hypothetical protein DWQ42_16185 [Planctomycetota bacterium]REK44762.1 MAG: hypothetical protein DWQ46_08595 [Planctomycetota bacterium]